MRYIRKSSEPQELLEWRKTDVKQNLTYGNMPKAAVRQALLKEQGYLCCYTGQRIKLDSCHIEHLKPRSVSKGEGAIEDTFDYRNLLAAFPSDDYERTYGKCPYGAHHRDNDYDDELLISPLNQDCDKHFRFDEFGNISPASTRDNKAEYTIRLLCLHHPQLNELRRQAIQGSLFRGKLSTNQIQRIIDTYEDVDGNGRLRPYNYVIQQVAKILLAKSQKLSKVRRRINKADKGKRKPK